MTNPDYTHIAVVVDRSGSMSSIADDMVGGLNEFFVEQAALPGTCLVDYAQFDDRYELVFQDKPVALAKAELSPRGMTALLDAVGKTVTTLGTKLAGMKEDERPGKVIVVVVTDGYENSSREWNAKSIKELVKKQEDEWQWDFVFLGANMDAVAVGQSFGFDPNKSLTYDTANVGAMASSLNSYTTRSRLDPTMGNAFSDKEREDNS